MSITVLLFADTAQNFSNDSNQQISVQEAAI